jgi:hypothetical protein
MRREGSAEGPKPEELMMTRGRAAVVLFLLLAILPPMASSQEVGPPDGSLVIVGGGMQDLAILERFVQLAGGPDAPIVVIPTAGGGEEYDEFYPGLRMFHEVGAMDLTVLHTTDRAVADSEEFVRPLEEARAVWFPGGRQWRLVDAYAGTRLRWRFVPSWTGAASSADPRREPPFRDRTWRGGTRGPTPS